MIDKYKRKLVLISVSIIFLVLSAIVVGINIANSFTISDKADIVINLLLENDGYFPQGDEEGIIIGKNEEGYVYLNPEIPYSSRYFTVKADKNGEVINLNCDRVVAIDSQTALEKFEKANSKKSSRGFIDNYRYAKKDTSEGTFWVFLDREDDVQNNKVFLFYSIMFLMVGTLLVLILILIFTDIILAPVEASYIKQRQFITDAGHELKTPLAVINANAEIIEMESGESEYVTEIKEQVSQLNELTKNLVLLSKLDEGASVQTFVQFNLTECIENLVKKLNSIAQTNNKFFTLQLDENVQYFGSEENIKRMLTLLFDNAIKYSKDQEIIIRMQKVAKKIEIATLNKCDFEKGNYDQLFERFYRHDKSRNKQTGGNGIGLSVVSSIANMHEGSVSANCDEMGILTIKVVLNILKQN